MSLRITTPPATLRSLRRQAVRVLEAQQTTTAAIREEINRRVSASLPPEQVEAIRRVWARWEAVGHAEGSDLDVRQLREDEAGNIYDRLSGALIATAEEATLLTAAFETRQAAFDAEGVG